MSTREQAYYADGTPIPGAFIGTSNPQTQNTVLVPDPANPNRLIPVPAKVENGVLVPVDQRYMAALYPQGMDGGGGSGGIGTLLVVGIIALIFFGSK